MASETHVYRLECDWEGGSDGTGHVSAPAGTIEFGRPPQIGGAPGRTNPEEMLLAAVASCYTITLAYLAERRRVPLVGLRMECVGEVQPQLGGTLKYTAIRLQPTITLSGADEAQQRAAEDIAHKAEQYCLVSNAIRGNVEVVLEPKIVGA